MIIHVNKSTVDRSCFACPTIFDFTDIDGRPYYFRLRHGAWRLSYDDTEQTIVSGSAPSGIDGVCSWEEAVLMVAAQGVLLFKSPEGE